MVVMMPAMMMPAADRLRQIQHVGKLAALRGVGEIRRKGGELRSRGGVAVRSGRLGGALQVGGDLLRYLLVLGWVGLLKLLERAHQLGKRG